MNKVLACPLAILVVVATVGCTDKTTSAPVDPPTEVPAAAPIPSAPAGTLVSNPLKNTAGISPNGSSNSIAVSAATFAYASALPGTFPGAVSASIRNATQNGAPQLLVVANGGFDPVAVTAVAGDELTLVIFANDGAATTFTVKVPPRAPPTVIRTSPSKGRTDVALNVQIQIVFSEPVDKTTITPGSVTLRRSGKQVAAEILVSLSGLNVEVIPNVPLDPEAQYVLELNQTILDLDGDGLANPTNVDFATSPVSPNATLLFTSQADFSIYSINVDGTETRRLTTPAGRDVRSNWSPDGRRFAFARNFASEQNRGFGTSDIFIVGANGSNAVRRTVGGFFWSASWSPDGKTLLLSDEEIYVAHIYLLSATDDGTSPTLLMSDGRTPKWSPDGKKIVYVHTSGDDGYHQIYLMDANGKNEHALTVLDPGGIQGVTWSPDGSHIAFSKCLSPGNVATTGGIVGCNIYLMNQDGSGLHVLADVGNAGDLTWSPDGLWIAFSTDDYVGSQWHPSVKYIPATGGAARLVVSGGFHPSWRP